MILLGFCFVFCSVLFLWVFFCLFDLVWFDFLVGMLVGLFWVFFIINFEMQFQKILIKHDILNQ